MDYDAFLATMAEASVRIPMRILAKRITGEFVRALLGLRVVANSGT